MFIPLQTVFGEGGWDEGEVGVVEEDTVFTLSFLYVHPSITFWFLRRGYLISIFLV